MSKISIKQFIFNYAIPIFIIYAGAKAIMIPSSIDETEIQLMGLSISMFGILNLIENQDLKE